MGRLGSLLSVAGILASSIMQGQGTPLPAIQVSFQIPKGWRKSSSSLFRLSNPDQQSRYWESELTSGHQPWRMDPLNVAAACLWDFGIQDGSTIEMFAHRLVVQKPNKEYSLSVGSQTFIVSVQTRHRVPIAYRFTVQP